MGYDPKERAIGWNDIGAGYVLTVVSLAGMLLVLGGEAPEHPALSDEAYHGRGSPLATENAVRWPGNGLQSLQEAGDRPTGEAAIGPQRPCPSRPKPAADRRPYAAG